MNKARLESFSDAVFAIVCTLLVVSLPVPRLNPQDPHDLNIAALVAMAPQFGSYVLSFALVTLYWVAHHDLVRILRSVSAAFLWINNFFLMWLALLPFPTEIMGAYPHNETAVLFFGLITIMAALAFIGLRGFVLLKKDLLDTAFDAAQLARSIRNSAIGVGLYFVALLVSYFSDKITITMYALIPFLFFVPVRIKSREPEAPAHAH
jgi:uncharacterized membrane protein